MANKKKTYIIRIYMTAILYLWSVHIIHGILLVAFYPQHEFYFAPLHSQIFIILFTIFFSIAFFVNIHNIIYNQFIIQPISICLILV